MKPRVRSPQQQAVYDYIKAAGGKGASGFEISHALYIADPRTRIAEINSERCPEDWQIGCFPDGTSQWGGKKFRYCLREFTKYAYPVPASLPTTPQQEATTT